MDVGQVSFKNTRLVKRIIVPARENPIVNRLNKTKTEVKQPDLKQEKDDHDKELRRKANAALQTKVRLYLASLRFARNVGCVGTGMLTSAGCAIAEKGRGETGAGMEGEEVAKGPCVR